MVASATMNIEHSPRRFYEPRKKCSSLPSPGNNITTQMINKYVSSRRGESKRRVLEMEHENEITFLKMHS